jgi:hypothetical protein
MLLADLTHVITNRISESELGRGVRVQILCNCATCGSSVSASKRERERESGRGRSLFALPGLCCLLFLNSSFLFFPEAFRWSAIQIAKATSVVCGESKAELSTHHIAPDLSLERFSAITLKASDLSEMGEQIGKGSFGTVWRATLKSGSAVVPVAVKGFLTVKRREREDKEKRENETETGAP